jgi:hypothetical protein
VSQANGRRLKLLTGANCDETSAGCAHDFSSLTRTWTTLEGRGMAEATAAVVSEPLGSNRIESNRIECDGLVPLCRSVAMICVGLELEELVGSHLVEMKQRAMPMSG